jgi:hypothetical protein
MLQVDLEPKELAVHGLQKAKHCAWTPELLTANTNVTFVFHHLSSGSSEHPLRFLPLL